MSVKAATQAAGIDIADAMGYLDTVPLRGVGEIVSLLDRLEQLIGGDTEKNGCEASDLTTTILNLTSQDSLNEYADLLCRACFHLFQIGKSTLGISIGKQIAARAELYGNVPVQRRIFNVIGGQYCDIADFASAMKYLEIAIVLARKLKDPLVEAACLGNVIAVLQEMGHYRQAITMAERVMLLDNQSDSATLLKLQCASNGLFAAHRVGDASAAARFLAEGQSYLSPTTEPFRRAFFERARALYLVDLGDAKNALVHFLETEKAIGLDANSRIRTLLTIAAAVCQWGLGNKGVAREQLETLHLESKSSRLYHHFVLQALIKVYSDSVSPADAAAGLSHARELVEYMTSVKKAKFYRQLANKREELDQRQSVLITATAIDPFGAARDWLIASDITSPEPELEPGEKRVLAKHEELTIIHDEMAKLRVVSLRRDIRTDAVDTAENWAIAAEFFDDETGQHCYRVGHLASLLARQIGMDETFCIQLEHAARLHDIGKIAVNEVILLKPGPLDASEMAAMRLHTEVGAQILSGSDDPTLKMAVEVARHHHEWWNGAGYPMKFCGRDIPLSARISAFADVYDALTHARAYKKAWTHERALDEILRLAGIQFDPNLINPFCEVIERYRLDPDSRPVLAFADMESNALIASRKKLMQTIAAGS